MERDPLRCTALSTYGVLYFDPATGKVVERAYSDPGDPSFLAGVFKIDVEEWRKHYPSKTLEDVSILDVGYWNIDGSYEPPFDWYKRQQC